MREDINKEVELRVEKRMADLMSAAGMPASRIAHELLYFIPREFRDMYVEVFNQALGGTSSATRPTGGQSGASRQATGGTTGATGRASGQAPESTERVSKGKRPYKRYWVVQDETALRIKERADKRLRQMAREMKRQLDGESEFQAGYKEGFRNGERGKKRACSRCHRFTDIEWRFCPTCGLNLED